MQKEINALWLKFPVKYMHGSRNIGVTGEYIYRSKNARDCYRVNGAEDVRYCQHFSVPPARDSYDHSNWGDNSEL